MKGVLQEKNLFLLWSDSFLYFEWRFELTDVGSHGIKSSEFGVKDVSYLHMKQKSFDSPLYLYLNNPRRFSNGRYVTIVLNKHNSVLDTRMRVNNSCNDKNIVDLLSSLKPLADYYPLTVICTVRALTSDVSQEFSDNRLTPVSALDHLNQLSLDFTKILDGAPYSDVVLNVDGASIKAHKMVLEARSAVFNKMFSHNSVEAVKNVVSVPDVGTKTMKRLVRYLYTGITETVDFNEILELYYAADKYEVPTLLEYCRTELVRGLDVNNACLLFSLANRHTDDTLKDVVLKYVIENEDSVLETETFAKMSNGDKKFLVRLLIRSMNK